MAVLNVTPDSFSDGGTYDRLSPREVRDRAQLLVEEGAALLDVGGESTRPGAHPVSEEEECRRVLPVLEALLDLDVVVSVDTCKAGVARRAVALGCHLVNDVTGFRDPEMLEVVAASEVGLAIMHMQGEPRTMQREPSYGDVVEDVREFLGGRVAACVDAGISRERICVDPGIGFGKTLAHNLQLLRNLAMFKNLAGALLVGVSRKRMLGMLTGRPVEARQAASLAAAMLAAQRGADIVRVHDVAETVDALKVLDAFGGQTEAFPAGLDA